jgi:hypothetical protein
VQWFWVEAQGGKLESWGLFPPVWERGLLHAMSGEVDSPAASPTATW